MKVISSIRNKVTQRVQTNNLLHNSKSNWFGQTLLPVASDHNWELKQEHPASMNKLLHQKFFPRPSIPANYGVHFINLKK